MNKKAAVLLVLCLGLALPTQSFAASSMFKYCNSSKANSIMIKSLRITGALAALKITLGAIWGMEQRRYAVKNDLHKVLRGLRYLDTTAGKIIVPLRNGLKAVLPTLTHFAKLSSAPDSVWESKMGRVFKGSLRSSARGQRHAATKSPLNPFFVGVFHIFTVWDVAAPLIISYATINKSVCAIVKAANPHCQKGAKDKNKCAIPTYNDLPSGDINDSDALQSTEPRSCNKAAAAQNYINYLNKLAPMVAKLKSIDSKLEAIINPLDNAATKAKNALNPFKGPMNGLKSALDIFKKGLYPLSWTSDQLQKAMNKKICVTLKIKVGKIKKKTKKCSRIKNVVKDVKKMAKPFEKPMKAAMNKVIDPLISKLLKKVSKIPGLNKISSVASKMGNSLGFVHQIKSKAEAIKRLPVVSLTSQLKSAVSQLTSLKNTLATAK